MPVSKTPNMKMPKGNSAKQGTAVGSGSRPTTGKYPIKSSAPSNPNMIRPAPSPLK